MADIVVIGSLNMDLVVRASRLPAVGETIPGQDLQMIPGGKGANQAAAASRLGGSSNDGASRAETLRAAEEAALKMLEWGVQTVIVTLGQAGALVADDEGSVHVPARRVEAVDITAAGDAFIGALSVALNRDTPIRDAVRCAT